MISVNKKRALGFALVLMPSVFIVGLTVWQYGIEAMKVYAVMAAAALIAIALIRCGARLIAESEK